MPRYRVTSNDMYFNEALGTYEDGMISGASTLQYGDEFNASTESAAGVLSSGAVEVSS